MQNNLVNFLVVIKLTSDFFTKFKYMYIQIVRKLYHFTHRKGSNSYKKYNFIIKSGMCKRDKGYSA